MPGKPLQTFDEGAEDLAGGYGHEKAQGNHGVDERIGGKVPDPLALQAHPREDVPDPLTRIDPGKDADAQMLGDPAPALIVIALRAIAMASVAHD